jgi:hypothetical protein
MWFGARLCGYPFKTRRLILAHTRPSYMDSMVYISMQ